MKNLVNHLAEAINEARIPQVRPDDVKTLRGFADYINNNPHSWEKFKDEIMQRNGWVEPEGNNPIEKRMGKPRKVCQEKGNKRACVYYNDSFGKYVSQEF